MHWVRANGERETAASVDGARPVEGDNAAEMSAFTAQQLGPERARTLGELPLSVVVDGVLFCHATPPSDEELVTRISIVKLTAADAVRSIDGAELLGGSASRPGFRSNSHAACRSDRRRRGSEGDVRDTYDEPRNLSSAA